MCLKQLICIYLYDNCEEKMGRNNGENRNTGKEEQSEKACSVGDLSTFIYSFLLGHHVKYLLRKAYFSRNERLTVCVINIW